MAIFKGSCVAIATPMKENGEVNYAVLDQLIEFQIENKTDAVCICGTTGESATLNDQEHIDLIGHAVKVIKGRVPVIAGTGSNDTAYAVHLSQEAEALGADACLLVSPYYNKATQDGLIAHFTKIAGSVKIPCILYNVPSRTGVNIKAETAAYLANNVENIAAIKEASGDFTQIANIARLAGDNMTLYSGNDDQIVPLCSLGGQGVISVLANVAPRETHDIVAKYLEGDTAGAAALQIRALPLISQLFCEVNPIPVKAALNIMGFDCGEPRLPLTVMRPEHQENLRREMKAFGVI